MDECAVEGEMEQTSLIHEQSSLESDANTDEMTSTRSEVVADLHSSCEILNNSDNGSWTSDTPLLPVHSLSDRNAKFRHNEIVESDIQQDKEHNENDNSEGTKIVHADEQSHFVDRLAPVQGQIFGSGVSMAFSHARDTDKVKANPLHVFGSGWEFGSVCSINLHASEEIANESQPHAPPWQGSLLSKILKEKIADLQIGKLGIKDTTEFLATDIADIPTKGENVPGTRNLKNLLVLSIGVMFLYIAVFGLRNLQSSMNSQDGIGVFSLALIGASFMFGSLVSPYLVQRFKPKICLSVACFGHLIYVITNYFPILYVMLPASVIQGLSSALLWNAICTYITEIGLEEAHVKGKGSCSVLSRYFGIFFLVLQLSMVLGNLISSLILSMSENRNKGSQNILVEFNNMTNISSKPAFTCGAEECGFITERKESSKDELDILFLLGTYSSCTILAILIIHCCLDHLANYTSYSPSFEVAMKQAGQVIGMVADPKFCFIVMLCLYTVLSNGFVVADVLKAYITCPIGIKMVGYSMICFGIFGSISSYMFGKLAKCIGHVGGFLTAAVINLVSLGIMVKWEPAGEDQYFLFALIGVWGFADGIWQSQINSLVSSVFADRYETAFGCCRMLQGLGGFVVFIISMMICMKLKIIITAASCLVSVVLFLIMEIVRKRETQRGVDGGRIDIKVDEY